MPHSTTEREGSPAPEGSRDPETQSKTTEAAAVSIPPHPLGVKPSGNRYTAPHDSRTSIGLFQILPDETLSIVLDYLDSNSLRNLGSCCKALYAFSRFDDLWKSIFVE
jgi:hypothetical protein